MNRSIACTRALLSTSAAIALTAGFPSAARAQTAAQETPQQEAQQPEQNTPAGSEIIVTGTRVVRNGYDAPTPTTVISAEFLEQRAPNNVMDVIQALPAMKQSSTTGTGGASAGGSLGQSFVNLRGLGPSRTLVLVNGQRVIPTTSVATVDVSLLPTDLIKRVDVVTGGASAAWGSDAIAGVVNFIFDTDFKGLRGDVQGGVTSRGDGRSVKVALTGGASLFNDRLSVLASGEYYQNQGVAPRSRPWAQYPSMDIVSNPAYAAGNGKPQFLLRPYVYQNIVNGGTIASGPLAGISFGPNGTTYNTPFCAVRIGTNQVCTSDQHDLFNNSNQFQYMDAPQTRALAYLRLAYDAGDWRPYVELMYGHSTTEIGTSAFSTSVSGALTIQRDNAYLPDTIRQRMIALNLQSFALGTFAKDTDPATIRRENNLTRVVAGITGKLGSWNIDAYFEHGFGKANLYIYRNQIKSRVIEAADAVVGPNGAIICRSALTNPATACQPFNVFGPNSFTQTSLAYFQGTTFAIQDTYEDAASLSVRGEPFSTWAGRVSVAAGAEYRRESVSQRVDAVSEAGGWSFLNPKPLSGNYNTKEAFAEVVVPLLSQTRFVRELDLNGAVRYTDYSTAGPVTTWKGGLTWKVSDDLSLRVTRSRDIRAPNLLELYSQAVGSTNSIVDPRSGSSVSVQGRAVGNPDLRYERSDTTAAGIVVSPRWIDGLRFSVDYYKILVHNAISTLTFQNIVNRCETISPELCGLIVRDPVSSQILAVNAPYLNLARLEVEGVDIETSYQFNLPWDAQMQVRGLASYLSHFIVDDGVTAIERAGSLGAGGTTANSFSGNPKWQFDITGTYTQGPLSASLEGIYYSSGAFDTSYAPGTLDGNHVGSNFRMNFGMRYALPVGNRKSEIYFNIDNLTDKAPPPELAYSGGNYDRIGRRFRLGVRFDL